MRSGLRHSHPEEAEDSTRRAAEGRGGPRRREEGSGFRSGGSPFSRTPNPKPFLLHRVIPRAPEGMAPQDPAQRQPRALDGAVGMQGIDRKDRTGRDEPTLTTQDRPKRRLVEPDAEDQGPGEGARGPLSGWVVFLRHVRSREIVAVSRASWYSASVISSCGRTLTRRS